MFETKYKKNSIFSLPNPVYNACILLQCIKPEIVERDECTISNSVLTRTDPPTDVDDDDLF